MAHVGRVAVRGAPGERVQGRGEGVGAVRDKSVNGTLVSLSLRLPLQT